MKKLWLLGRNELLEGCMARKLTKNIWNALMTSIHLHDNLKNKDNCNKTLKILWWKKKKDANDTLNYPSPNKAKVVSQIK